MAMVGTYIRPISVRRLHCNLKSKVKSCANEVPSKTSIPDRKIKINKIQLRRMTTGHTQQVTKGLSDVYN